MSRKLSTGEKIGVAFGATAAAAGSVFGLTKTTPSAESNPVNAVALAGKGITEYSETVLPGSSAWAIGIAACKAEDIPATDTNVDAAKQTIVYASGTESNGGYLQAGQNFNFDVTHPVIHPEDLKAVGAEAPLPKNNQ